MLVCQFCNRDCKNSNSYNQHIIRCLNNPDRISFLKIEVRCQFCDKICNIGAGLNRHENVCDKNPDKGVNLNGFSKARGLNLPIPSVSAETRSKIAEKSKAHRHTEETKISMSKRKIALYASGWEPVCGRCKKYDHVSPIAGKIKVDGTWELFYARFLDDLGVQWNRNKIRFPYIHINGKMATYQPDFYVKEWESFVEIKGYETNLDRCKWSQFSEKLIVIRKKEIGELDERFKSAPC